MFVLGIDPGLTRCGFGVIEGSLKNVETFTALRAGVLESPAEWPVERRLASLLVDLRELMADVRPDVVVVERVFFQRNARTAISVLPNPTSAQMSRSMGRSDSMSAFTSSMARS